MLHVDARTLEAALPWRDAIEALREAHATREMPMKRSSLFDDPGGGEDRFVNLTAWSSGRSIAVKMVGVFPKNPARPVPEPSVQGLVALFDGTTGRALMTCDGASLTYRKTAADSALGVDLLARRDARTLVLAGAGGLAPHVVAAHREARPGLDRVILWNRTEARARALAEALREPGLTVEVATSIEDALPEGDIVSAVTMARRPVIAGALLRPGAHVDLIGAYRPDMREADDEVLRRAGRLFVDTRAGCEGSGDVAEPLAAGVIGPQDIVADYFDLCTGRHPGRAHENEITVCKNVGGGHLDLFVMERLHARLAPG
jgi:ornithine cyclodeaminase/alanine dehydrogenase-like protein (mu-crystallin family)